MKRKALLATLLFVIVAGHLGAQGRGPGRRGIDETPCPQLASIPAQPLSQVEQHNILYMREEEKLARDVYRGLFQRWGTNVFARIAEAEQRHMQAIGLLMARYELSDPVTDDTPGVFTDQSLSSLYVELMAQGALSLKDAIRVGAGIEDLDIRDLNEAISQSDNEDIKLIFGNLTAGSHNHLRAFSARLGGLGESYEAQFISPAQLETILATGPGRGRGQGTPRF